MIQIKHKATGKILLEVKSNNLVGVNLSYAFLDGVNLRWGDLTNGNLRYADLEGADLREANLEGANLEGADLTGADLTGSKNIKSFRCGDFNRESYAVKHEDKIMFKIGCFWGTIDEALPLIRDKYGVDSYYEKLVTIYNDMMMEQ